MNAIALLQENLPESIEAAWIEDEADRFYLTGMKSSAGTVLVTRAAAWLLIDFRYVEEAEAKVKNCTVLEQKNLFAQAASLLRESGVKRLSVLSSQLTVSRFREMAARLPDVALDASGALDRLLDGIGRKNAEKHGHLAF